MKTPCLTLPYYEYHLRECYLYIDTLRDDCAFGRWANGIIVASGTTPRTAQLGGWRGDCP
jgi:hypothetical protein